jgi:hypothetical protein
MFPREDGSRPRSWRGGSRRSSLAAPPSPAAIAATSISLLPTGSKLALSHQSVLGSTFRKTAQGKGRTLVRVFLGKSGFLIMKTPRTPAMILGLLYLCFFGSLVCSAYQLPDRLATHFNGNGQPDGWMTRSEYLLLTGLSGSLLLLFFVGLFFAIRAAPGGLNMPHRDYWLSPEQRVATFDFIFCQLLTFSCMFISFFIGIHLLTIQANALAHPRLSILMILGLAGCLTAGLVILVVTNYRHFSTLPPSQSAKS